ncbi:uncharacterized protein [Palaemon carinicauda]|uniref:uncharacterized protein n=1 Tax=Palaemon carinicauda TaxID=392227 RepID=UPI0035B5C0C5
MEVSSGGLLNGILVFFGTVVLLNAPCKGGPIDETDTSFSTCNTGWELCPTTNLCVLAVCKDIDYSKIEYNHMKCQHGQVPCEAAGGACMWPCPKPTPLVNPSSPLKPTCGIGKIYCERTMTCTTEEECYSMDDFKPSCSFGSTFCLAKGGCVTGGCDDERKTERRYNCPLGQILCLSSETCVYPDQCKEAREQKSPLISCSQGEVFCAATGSCTPVGGCGKDNGGFHPINVCSDGKGFCSTPITEVADIRVIEGNPSQRRAVKDVLQVWYMGPFHWASTVIRPCDPSLYGW